MRNYARNVFEDTKATYLHWVHECTLRVRVIKSDRVADFVGGNQKKAVTCSLAKTELFVCVEIRRCRTPTQKIRTANCCALSVRIALEDEWKRAAGAISISS